MTIKTNRVILFHFAILLFAFIASCEKATIEGNLQRVYLPSNIRVQLQKTSNFETFITIPRIDGYFQFDDLDTGKYILEVQSVGYNFSKVEVDVLSKDRIYARSDNMQMSYPLNLAPNYYYQLIQKRAPFDFMGIGKTILIMGGISGAVLFLIKKIDFNQLQEEMQRATQEAQQLSSPSTDKKSTSSSSSSSSDKKPSNQTNTKKKTQ